MGFWIGLGIRRGIVFGMKTGIEMWIDKTYCPFYFSLRLRIGSRLGCGIKDSNHGLWADKDDKE